jgi:hypothetical protein
LWRGQAHWHLLEPCKVEESLTNSEELGNLGIKQELQVVLKSELTSLQMSLCVCVCVLLDICFRFVLQFLGIVETAMLDPKPSLFVVPV